MHSDSTRLLHVDDDVDFAEMVSLFLRKEQEAFEIDTVHDVETALDRLEAASYHCVVSDYEMPGATGLDLLRAVRESYPDLPFVLFTGKGSEEIAAEAISAGVSDYLQKGGGTDQYTVLANRVDNLVASYRTERHLQQRIDAIEAASEGIGLIGSDGNVVYTNEAFAETLGYDADGLVGVAVEEFFVDSALVEREVRPMAADETWTGEVRLVRRDGTEMLTDVTLAHTADDSVVCTLREVTVTEQQEHELFVKERAMDAAPIGIIITDSSLPDNGIVYANDEFERLTGYSEAEIIGDNCRFLQGEETDPAHVAEMREAIEAERPVTVELRNYRRDGTPFWNRVTVAPIDGGDDEVTNYVGFQRDITQEVDARREQEAVFDRVSDAFFALDRDWQFTYLNDQAERLLGRDRDDLVGKSVWEEFPEAVGSTFDEQYRTAMETQETVSFEEYYPPLSMWLEVRAYPSETGLSVYFRDISEREANERRLEQRARQFETFGDVLSHDLTTPLSTLDGRLELARETGDAAQFDAAEAALDRVEALVDDLANVMREGSVVNDVEPVDVGQVTRELWSSIETATATLDAGGADGLMIRADRQALTRLLQNLVRNGVEHGSTGSRTGAGDAVEHGSTGEESTAGDSVQEGGPTVTVGRLDDGDGFFVADDGPGIPPDEREAVFGPGYTTKQDGTGFGMVSVRQIALAHGWDIGVAESETGGARFEISGVEQVAADVADGADD
jgi:PAS domain S-box-containing protein